MKLDAKSQLILDQPALRTPIELLRRNFKACHKLIEKESAVIDGLISDLEKKASDASSIDEVLAALDAAAKRTQVLQTKVKLTLKICYLLNTFRWIG